MRVRALVVDDAAVIREVLKQMLQHAGLAEWDFIDAADGVEALARFNPRHVDIVFVDWNMPRMTGTEFIRKAREKGHADHIPMVMVTGKSTVGEMEMALDEYGADEYITKPLNVADLRTRLKRPLEQIAAHRARHPERPGLLERLISRKH